jgi:dUTP pyrophosphatase
MRIAFSTPYIKSLYYNHRTNEGFHQWTRRKGDAGIDLRCPFDTHFETGQLLQIQLGVYLEIPWHCVGLLAVRSSMGKNGFSLENGVGFIDAGYRGQLSCPIRYNGLPGAPTSRIMATDRIVQLAILPCLSAGEEFTLECVEKGELEETERGDGGFGSTGAQ